MGPQVAVTAGASRVRELDIALGHITASRLPANLTLARHSHPQATVAIILAGGWFGRYLGTTPAAYRTARRRVRGRD